MAGEKTRELELKKMKKMTRGPSSFTPSPGCIQCDWPPSTVTEEAVQKLCRNRDGGCHPPTTSIPSRRTTREDEESEDETDEDNEDESEDEVEYLPSPDAIREGRTKMNQDPSGVTPTTRATKRARAEAKQQASPPPAIGKGTVEVINQKPRKVVALPMMRKPMPIVSKVVPSASFTIQATENISNRSKGTLDAGVVSSKVAKEVNPAIELESGHEQARNSQEILPSLSESPIPMDTTPGKSPSHPKIQSSESIQTPIAREPISPSTLEVSSPRRNQTPSIFSTSFSLERSLEDEVSASKEAMLQAEQMETRLKELLILNETLKTNIQKTCELGTKYLGLQKELKKVRRELEEEQGKTMRLEKEKTAMEESMKNTIEEKDIALGKTREEADAKTKKGDDRWEELQEIRQMNDHYMKEVEDMKKQIKDLKACESEWHTKYLKWYDLAEMTKMKYEKDLGDLKQGMYDAETFLVGQLDEVNQRLEVFCPDPVMEDHKVQKELEAYGIDIKETPWASTRVAEAVIRLDERAKAAKGVIAQVRKSMKGINATLHPGEEVDEALPICLQHLEQVPGRVSRFKKSVTRCGANVALALTRVHFPKIDEVKLQNIGVGNPEGDNFEDHMKTFMRTAGQIASLIGLDLCAEPTRVPDTSEEELAEEEEKIK
ncbi:uncharacterized protein LOC123404347 [Hordeum vulgare subsp. vulgare]|uniref:Uncharacterized protein n=1 Tax=Hordeum vulgare subsp. vulgare TaxID=112509 RepID=A0A8I6WGM0_HORVV|nr:uncharacterized protein LOC123404347 [Hordeum vulgare subsp. vulgare]